MYVQDNACFTGSAIACEDCTLQGLTCQQNPFSPTGYLCE
jgi:predicted outer membrane repeat protein